MQALQRAIQFENSAPTCASFANGLAAGLLPWSARARVTAVFWGYFDETGVHKDPHTFALAGYVGSERLWQHFEIDWLQKLQSAGIAEFHRVDAYHGQGEFKDRVKWPRAKREQFTRELATIITRYKLFGFCLAVNAVDYRTVFVPQLHGRERIFNDPYLFCLQGCIDEMFEVQPDPPYLPRGERISVVLSWRPEVMGKTITHFYDVVEAKGLGDVFHAVAYCKPRKCIALQAADLLAWEAQRFGAATLANPHALYDPVFARLIRNRRAIFRYADKERFAELLLQLKAKRRSV